MSQLALFLSEPAEVRLHNSPAFPSILFDVRLGDHVARAVAHLGRVWIYHGRPGHGMDYNGNLTRIDEVPAGLGPQEIAEKLVTGQARKVWPL